MIFIHEKLFPQEVLQPLRDTSRDIFLFQDAASLPDYHFSALLDSSLFNQLTDSPHKLRSCILVDTQLVEENWLRYKALKVVDVWPELSPLQQSIRRLECSFELIKPRTHLEIFSTIRRLTQGCLTQKQEWILQSLIAAGPQGLTRAQMVQVGLAPRSCSRQSFGRAFVLPPAKP